MAENITILVPDGIAPPTAADIQSAKDYVLLRNQAELALAAAIDEILEKYIRLITRACYKYNIAPQDFTFAANDELRREVYALLDEMDEEIYSLIEESVVPNGRKNSHFAALIDWMLTLGTHNWSFRTTLRYYIFRFSQDVEALVAAMRFAGLRQNAAIQKMLSALYAPYSLAEMMAAVRSGQFFSADMIRSGGTKDDPFTHRPAVGLSKVGATNLTTMARSTLSMTYMRDLFLSAQEQGRAGYYVFRGSSYICPTCDNECGWFHPLQDGIVVPLHAHCKCFIVFVDSLANGDNLNTPNYY